ncbi:MAG TPA: tetratricopeptide repeat protein, partial [Candidatus Hydrogenedentes bacterium]|nr:tetratricopeptide repeat protein [Candidatus Hydrogenedentota bacterium]
IENAKAVYGEAIARPFYGPQNRADTAKRLGVLHWQAGELEAAAPLLREAAVFDPPPLSVFEPLCDCLMALGQYAEAEGLIARWITIAGELGLPLEIAKAKYYEGEIALAQGDPERAEACFLEGVQHVPGGRNASELGLMYYEQGALEQALPYIDAYLETGTGERAEYFRWLRGHIVEKVRPATGDAGRSDGSDGSGI